MSDDQQQQQSQQSTSLIIPSDSTLVSYEEHIDASSVIPRTQLERLLERERDHSSDLPLHLQQLEALPYSDLLKEQIVSVYSNEAQQLSRFMNREIEVLGMVVWEILPGLIKPVNKGDPSTTRPGFYQIRILTSLEDQDRNYIVLRSSSVSIATTVFFILKNQRPWLFEKSLMFRFFIGNGGMHHMVKSGESLKELKDMLRERRKS